MELKSNDKIKLVVFLLPGLLLFLTFFIIPTIYVFVVSFLKWDGVSDPSFTAIDNYITIFKDVAFQLSIRNNIIWAACAAFIQVPLALLMALVLSKKPKGWKFFRTVYFFPQLISGIALAMLWQAVYNSEFGVLNGILKAIGLEQYATNWLGNPDTALFSVIIYWIFYIGYYMVIIMSDISGIDESLYEAAEIDGATKIQQDIRITVPLLKSSMLTCTTLAAILGLRTFEQIYTLTSGGPANKTSVMVMYLYKQMQNYNYGTANATAVVLIIVGTAVIIALRKAFSYYNR